MFVSVHFQCPNPSLNIAVLNVKQVPSKTGLEGSDGGTDWSFGIKRDPIEILGHVATVKPSEATTVLDCASSMDCTYRELDVRILL